MSFKDMDVKKFLNKLVWVIGLLAYLGAVLGLGAEVLFTWNNLFIAIKDVFASPLRLVLVVLGLVGYLNNINTDSFLDGIGLTKPKNLR